MQRERSEKNADAGMPAADGLSNLAKPDEALLNPFEEIDDPSRWVPSGVYLKFAAVALLLAGAAAVIVLRVFLPAQTLRLIGPLLIVCVGAVAWYLVAHGRNQTAIKLMAIGMWIAVTVIVTFTGGVRAPMVVAYPGIILLVGMLTSWRWTLALAGLTLAATVGFVLTDAQGLLPQSLLSSAAKQGLDQSLTYIVMAVFGILLVRGYQFRLMTLRRISNDLACGSQALEASQAELHRAQAVANVGSWVGDVAANRMRLSAETCRILGLSEGTIWTYEDYLSHVHPDDLESVRDAWEAALKGSAFDHEHRILAGEEIHWVHQKGELEFAADGRLVGVFGTTHDITERKEAEAALRESEEQYKSIFSSASMGIFHSTPEGRFLRVNPALARMLGYASPEELVSSITDIKTQIYVEPDKRQPMVEAVSENRGEWRYTENRYRRKDGGILFGDLMLRSVVNTNGTLAYLEGFVQDVTERRRAENELRSAREMMHAAVSAGWIFPWTWDVVNDRLSWAVSPERLLGSLPENASSYGDFRELVHPEDREAFLAAGQEALAAAGPYQSEFRIVTTDGRLCWVAARGETVANDEGRVVRMIGASSDITERKRMEAQVHQLAFHDVLTDLPNRRLLIDRLSRAIAASRRSRRHGAVLFLDLDNLKALNDTQGHEIGDLLLIAVADRLKACIRDMDTAARFGGDEFVIIVGELEIDEDESSLQAAVVAEKIRSVLAAPYVLRIEREGGVQTTLEHNCTASIGVALFGDHDVDEDEILKRADQAMYQAKQAGRNSIRFY